MSEKDRDNDFVLMIQGQSMVAKCIQEELELENGSLTSTSIAIGSTCICHKSVELGTLENCVIYSLTSLISSFTCDMDSNGSIDVEMY